MPCSLFLEWLKLRRFIQQYGVPQAALPITSSYISSSYLVYLKASELEECICPYSQGHSSFYIIAGFGHSHPSPLGIQPFKTYCSFFPFHFSGHSLQFFRIVALPCAWGGWQAAHQGHGLGRNFLSPPVPHPEIVVKLMGYLSSKFSNKASQLVRTIQPQLVLVWSQGLPQMSLPGPVQKLQSL